MNLREFIEDAVHEELLSAAWKRMNQSSQPKLSETLKKFLGLQNAADRANSTQENFEDRTAANRRDVSKKRFEAVKDLKMVFNETNKFVGEPLEIEGMKVKFAGVSVEAINGFVDLHFRYTTEDGGFEGEFVVSADEGFEFVDAPPGIHEKANRRLFKNSR
jgi:hypothetical protein